jgi:uncharacterized protein (DUF697 family)
MSDPVDETQDGAAARIAAQARGFAPVVWLVGKVQSGKSSIVRTLTGSSEAEIGSGFSACTTTSRVFDFPAEAPIIRFLDTRGVGEVGYQPDEDIAFCEERAHLVIAVVKAADMAQGPVLEVLAAVRRRHRDWPLVVAQTNLHELYAPGARHAAPYVFEASASTSQGTPLERALAHQRALFQGLPGRAPSFVPIDFTLPGDGFDPVDYGHEALVAALIEAAPQALSDVLARLPGEARSDKSVDAYVLGFALAAGASDAVPVAGLAMVPMVQAAMLHQVARKFETEWDKARMTEFAGALGAGTLLRVASGFGVRQLVKLVPVYGQTVGAAAAAAASFATTYAMGKAAAHYLNRRRSGMAVRDVARVYKQALAEAFAYSKTHPITPAGRTGASPGRPGTSP